jgi:hypothetical protein
MRGGEAFWYLISCRHVVLRGGFMNGERKKQLTYASRETGLTGGGLTITTLFAQSTSMASFRLFLSGPETGISA